MYSSILHLRFPTRTSATALKKVSWAHITHSFFATGVDSRGGRAVCRRQKLVQSPTIIFRPTKEVQVRLHRDNANGRRTMHLGILGKDGQPHRRHRRRTRQNAGKGQRSIHSAAHQFQVWMGVGGAVRKMGWRRRGAVRQNGWYEGVRLDRIKDWLTNWLIYKFFDLPIYWLVID